MDQTREPGEGGDSRASATMFFGGSIPQTGSDYAPAAGIRACPRGTAALTGTRSGSTALAESVLVTRPLNFCVLRALLQYFPYALKFRDSGLDHGVTPSTASSPLRCFLSLQIKTC